MKKMMFRSTFILVLLFISIVSVFAAVRIITKTGSVSWSGTWTVSADSLWEYETGRYNGPGSFTVTAKPSDTLFITHSVGLNSSSGQGTYTGHQYYIPSKTVVNVSGGYTSIFGPIIHITFSSPGPMRVAY